MKNLINLNFFNVGKFYQGMIKKPFHIDGTLLEKNKNKVVIDVGNQKIIEAVLKNPLKEEAGDQVFIDKSMIISLRVYDKEQDIKPQNTNVYQEALKMYGIEETKEALDAVKTLEKFGVPTSKDAVETLMTAKKYFDMIKQDLDYDMAVKLLGKDVDLEHESIQKVAEKIEEIKAEDEVISLLKLLNIKKEMTTKEAEQIAKHIYGSEMGKDITDIIKALYRVGAEITKKSVEVIYDVFYKLGKLQEMEEKGLVHVHKQDMVPTIENIYNTVYHVKEGSILGERGVSPYAAAVYENTAYIPSKTTEKDFSPLEKNIETILEDIEIEATPENIKLAGELIRQKLPLTKERMNEIIEIKKTLKILRENLDVQSASALMKEGLDIEKCPLKDLIKELMRINSEDGTHNVLSEEVKEIYQRLERLKEIKDTDLIKLLKNKVDFKLSEVEKIVGHLDSKEGDVETLKDGSSWTDKIMVKGLGSIIKISGIFDKVKTLDFDRISFHMAKKIPLTLKTIEETVTTNTDSLKMNKMEEQQIESYLIMHKENLNKTFQGVAGVFDAAKALLQNKVTLSIHNLQYVFEAYGQYSRIRKNLTAQMVLDGLREDKDLQTMELKALDSYIKQKTANTSLNTYNHQESFQQAHGWAEGEENGHYKIPPEKIQHIKELTENILKINKEEKLVLPLLLRNNMEFTLKEIERLTLLLKNQHQLGDRINECIQFAGELQHPQLRENILRLEKLAKDMSRKLKVGDGDTGEIYDELLQHIENMHKDMDFAQEEENSELKKHMSDLIDCVELQKRFNLSKVFQQFPLLIGEQVKNLQLYIPPHSNIRKKTNEEMLTSLVNLDTNSMGQIHMEIQIGKESVNLSISVEHSHTKDKIQTHISDLQELLKEAGYVLKNVSFSVTNEQQILERMQNDIMNQGNLLLNMKI